MPYWQDTMRRLAMALLVILALLAMPIGMAGNAAQAHAPATNSLAALTMGHCGQPGDAAGKAKDAGLSPDCALACAALPAFEPRLEPPAAAAAGHHNLALPHFAGTKPESRDPPPRV